MNEKKEKKDQFVIAYLPDFTHEDTVLSHAALIARMLDKGLILLCNQDPKYGTGENPESHLKELQQRLSCGIQVSYIALATDTRLLIEALPLKLNGVVAIAAADPKASRKSAYHPKEVLANFANSKIAYLTAQEPFGKERYSDAALCIDFHRESKEKLIWSSYFARFGKANLHVLYHDYKDDGLKQKWYNNMLFLNKFYANLGIGFLPHIIPKKSSSPDMDALPFIAEHHYDLLVAITTKEKDIIDSILGAQETRIIKNPQKIPVLFLNPRDDIYVLCD